MFKFLNPINWFKRKPAAFSPTTVLRAKVGYVTADDMRRPKADRYEYAETDASGVTTVYEGGTSSKLVEHDVLRFRTGDGKIHTMYASPEAKVRVQQREAEERRRREEDAERVRRESEDRWRRDEYERRNASMFAAAIAPTASSHSSPSPAPTYEAACPPPPSYESPSPSPSYDGGSCSRGDY